MYFDDEWMIMNFLRQNKIYGTSWPSWLSLATTSLLYVLVNGLRYWLLLVRNLMSPNKFRKTKTYLHCCDNTNLDETNKWIKLRRLTESVNEELQQFRMLSSELSIDEQMVPYFGRYSCKMFIRDNSFLSFLLKYKNSFISYVPH